MKRTITTFERGLHWKPVKLSIIPRQGGARYVFIVTEFGDTTTRRGFSVTARVISHNFSPVHKTPAKSQ